MSREINVFLIGAGPGAADLISLRALHVLRAAEVVIYDRLVADEVLAEIPEGAERIYVGKQGNMHGLPQPEISRLVVDMGRSGRRVVRLKGGDPYIFGRGGEEALALVEAGIGFEVVPGVTAASGVMAQLGLPLTHRGLATGVRFVTGQCGKDSELPFDWAGMADPHTTLVIYMGLAKLPIICGNLIDAGLPASTPALAVSNGTLPQQKICLSTVAGLPDRVKATGIGAPAITVIGAIVGLAEELKLPWAAAD